MPCPFVRGSGKRGCFGELWVQDCHTGHRQPGCRAGDASWRWMCTQHEGGGFTTQLFLLSTFTGETKSPWYEWGAAQILAEKGVTAMPNLHGIQPRSGLSVAPMARIPCSHRGHKLLPSDHLSSWCIWDLEGRICIHQRHPHFPLRHSPQLITPETRGIPVSHR